MSKKSFHIGDILSVSTGALVSATKLDGVYELMDHVVRDTSISPREAVKQAQAFIHRELPWTKDIAAPKVPEGLGSDARNKLSAEFVQQQADKYGAFHEIGQIPYGPEVAGTKEFFNQVQSGKSKLGLTAPVAAPKRPTFSQKPPSP